MLHMIGSHETIPVHVFRGDGGDNYESCIIWLEEQHVHLKSSTNKFSDRSSIIQFTSQEVKICITIPEVDGITPYFMILFKGKELEPLASLFKLTFC